MADVHVDDNHARAAPGRTVDDVDRWLVHAHILDIEVDGRPQDPRRGRPIYHVQRLADRQATGRAAAKVCVARRRGGIRSRARTRKMRGGRASRSPEERARPPRTTKAPASARASVMVLVRAQLNRSKRQGSDIRGHVDAAACRATRTTLLTGPFSTRSQPIAGVDSAHSTTCAIASAVTLLTCRKERR